MEKMTSGIMACIYYNIFIIRVKYITFSCEWGSSSSDENEIVSYWISGSIECKV